MDSGTHFSETSAYRLSATPSEEPALLPPDTPPASGFPLEESPARPVQQFAITLSKNPNFDASEFLSVPNTQASTFSSQPVAELEEQDNRISLSSSGHSQETIPDSQDYSGPSFSEGHYIDAGNQSLVALSTTQDEAAVDGDSGNSHSRASASSIPSRQPAAWPLSHGEPNTPAELNETLRESVLAQTAAEVDVQPEAPSSPEHHPLYFTQPDTGHQFVEPQSSISSIATDSIPQGVIESTPEVRVTTATESQVPPVQSPTVSQGAQIVEQYQYSAVDIVSDSNSTVAKVTESSLKQRDSTSPAISEKRDSPQENLGDIEMPDSEEQRRESRSAVDELNSMFTLEPNTELDDNSATLDIVPQDEHREVISDMPGSESVNIRTTENEDGPMASGALDGAALERVPQQSATEALQSIVDMAFSQPEDLAPSGTLAPGDVHHTTISPADIVGIDVSQGIAPSDVFDTSSNVIPMNQQYETQSPPKSRSGTETPVQMHHLVTLPFQSSLRPTYDETLLESRRAVTAFGEIFNSPEFTEPEPDLVDKIDQLLNKLYNICDYPQDVVGTSLERLPPLEQTKYCCDVNSKFSFVFELLQGIETDMSFLIIASSTELLSLLFNVADALEIGCTARALNKRNDYSDSAASVTLILSNEQFDISEIDVVVGFDHTFRQSPVAQTVSEGDNATQPPLVLTLITTHSIEHIDMQLPAGMHALERRNALLSGIVNARKLVDDPDRGYPEPHELASLFYEYINGKAESIIWEPVPLPSEVLDIYESSQMQSQIPATVEQDNSRKRKLDEDEDEDAAKRLRTITAPEAIGGITEPPLPDDVAWLLESMRPDAAQKHTAAKISVPLSILQVLTEKYAELTRQKEISNTEVEYKTVIESLEKRIKEYERTSSKIYKSHRSALQDRAKYEAGAKAAEAALQKSKDQAQKDSDKFQSKVTEYEARIARLTAAPEGSGESPLARSESLLKESQDKAKSLEERVKLAQKEAEYARALYQDGSSAAGAMRGEINDLRKQNEELQQKSTDSLTAVHKINAEMTTKEYLAQIKALKSEVQEREAEVDRIRDDLRQLKSRRETRQSSVPRSPRMAMMSPRPGRPFGASTSRATSPAPMSEAVPLTTSAPGNGRWNHLRE